MGRHAKNPETEGVGLAIRIPQTTTTNRPAGIKGQIVFNSTTATFQVHNGSNWYNWSTAADEKTITIDKFQGDGTTVTFGTGAASGSMLGGAGNDAAFTQTVNDATDIMVFVGGVYQVPTTNYSIPTTDQITFGSAPPANDGVTNGHVITIMHGIHKLGE
jgi:hypothetical protein|tara:strand:+ start:372 stop:851 length:480 start_codon:yes stop_codon:yes gene_type:complete